MPNGLIDSSRSLSPGDGPMQKELRPMCFSITTPTMTEWLKNQIRVLELWREELAMRADIDLSMVTRLERHYHWLTHELAELELVLEPGYERAALN